MTQLINTETWYQIHC